MYIFKNIIRKAIVFNHRIWSALKFLFPRFVGLINVFFLRKTNTFIKSKYSKNRQWSKSIVYFGLWFGVISAFAFTYYNYRFLFSFSYLWWAGASVALIATINGIRRNGFTTKPFILNIFS